MIAQRIKDHDLHVLGFDDCRFTSPFLEDADLAEYRSQVTDNAFGDMTYLNRHLPFKENPNLLLPGVQSAIVLIKNYKNTSEQQLPQQKKIARYAVGQDYHLVISDALTRLVDCIEDWAPDSRHYIGVDSRPIADRSLALKAGIGFRGRNTMVIKPKLGSYFLIGIVFTTLKLPADSLSPGTCGSCRRCIDACPTGALVLDEQNRGSMQPKKCISYQTIEQKTPVEPEILATFKGWTFGCDICQEVCPFNHAHTPQTDWDAFKPHSGVGFDFFDQAESAESLDIPKNSAMYRSRKRVKLNARF